MTSANKVRSVTRNLEQLIEELPVFLLRMEEVMAALDDKFEWREFKFCFKVGTSKVVMLKMRYLLPIFSNNDLYNLVGGFAKIAEAPLHGARCTFAFVRDGAARRLYPDPDCTRPHRPADPKSGGVKLNPFSIQQTSKL